MQASARSHGRRLRIVNHLDTELSRLLADHWTRPEVIEPPKNGRPWELPEDTDAVVTAPSAGWATAPKIAPSGWPGRTRWIHTVSAGVDALPAWLGEAGALTCGRGVASAAICRYVMSAIGDSHNGIGGTARTLGLAGFGAIGRAVAQAAQSRGTAVTVLRRQKICSETGERNHPNGIGHDALRCVRSFEELIAGVDDLVLALPLTPQTRHLVNARTLACARPGLHLVNVARGALVDHDALARALQAGTVARATLDVTDPEPLPDAHPLRRLSNVRITPHIAWESEEHLNLRNSQVLRNLSAFAAGDPLHEVVDMQAGY